MIKARPVGGDREAANNFLEWISPFIWRKNLDFAAINDIHSIKRQITAHKGKSKIIVAGHNVKLGRGGIREVEFFTQTQQLIWGGRLNELRVSSTEKGLIALAKNGQITKKVKNEMITAYRYLRRVEHRIQMINDEQTHSLPVKTEEISDIAAFLGHKEARHFAKELTNHLKIVEKHYGLLFEGSPSLSSEDTMSGNLVFTGCERDPETIKTIKHLGFNQPEIVDETIRGWHHGRYKAMRNARARELLTEILPILLKSISRAPKPDKTFLKFDKFLSCLPSGVQLFSMFYSNPSLLKLVAEIIGGAPRLAEYLSRQPQVLEIVLTAGFFDKLPTKQQMKLELNRLLKSSFSLEDIIITTQRWSNEKRFQVGVLCLLLKINQSQSARALSDIADIVIMALHKKVEDEMILQHGQISGSYLAILALGKLGSREMTPESDLDLVFIYVTPKGSSQSNGVKALPTEQYFSRLSQRLIAAMTAKTSEGHLYEVDMRLRPSGTAGPIASSLNSFRQYHARESWTWEQMALTRARIICAPVELKNKITKIINKALTRRRKPQLLSTDIIDMRERILKTHKTNFIWDVKHIRGGLVDVEFISQFLQLLHGHKHPDIFVRDSKSVFKKMLNKKLVSPQIIYDLLEALELWQSLQGMLRLTIPRETRQLRNHDIPEGLRCKLLKLIGTKDYSTLVGRMNSCAENTFYYFNTIINKTTLIEKNTEKIKK